MTREDANHKNLCTSCTSTNCIFAYGVIRKQCEFYETDKESKELIDELSKMPPMVIATAYLHAINYTLYGEDVTEKWLTATQNASALEKAYQKGYHDAMERVNKASKASESLRACAESGYYIFGCDFAGGREELGKESGE